MVKRLTVIVSCLLALAALWAVWTYVYTPWALKREYPMRYEIPIKEAAARYDLDEKLIFAIVWAESGFRPEAVSRVGATGLMQVMPETGEWVAGKLGVEYGDEMLTEPEYNLSLGCWYVDYLLERFDGDITKAVAGYHAGGGKVNEWLRDPAYSPDGHTLEDIPPGETHNYVKKVLKAHEVYTELYGDR